MQRHLAHKHQPEPQPDIWYEDAVDASAPSADSSLALRTIGAGAKNAAPDLSPGSQRPSQRQRTDEDAVMEVASQPQAAGGAGGGGASSRKKKDREKRPDGGADDAEGGRPQHLGKKLTRGQGGPDTPMYKTMLKTMLQLQQQQRTVAGVLFDAFIIKST